VLATVIVVEPDGVSPDVLAGVGAVIVQPGVAAIELPVGAATSLFSF
jgi:hypothetical protein